MLCLSADVCTYHGPWYGTRVRTRVLRTYVVVRTCISSCFWDNVIFVRTRVRTSGTMVLIPTYVYVQIFITKWYQWYHGTRVPLVPLVRTMVPLVRTTGTYHGIMLCHNFLIGKGHTCALRTTCVLGGYTAASWERERMQGNTHLHSGYRPVPW